MATRAAPPPGQTDAGTQTLGVVSFLNALPLHEALGGREDVAIRPAVPSRLREMLMAGECDVALLPIVDTWRRQDRLVLLSDACIASDGETMTVRVFSKLPPDKVEQLHVDGDSRTSVILAQLLWLELYGRRLDLKPYRGDGDGPRTDGHAAASGVESVLLIGDKVVRDAPRGFGFEVDLGAAWKHLTGLPFVFAAWFGTKVHHPRAIAAVLQAARDAGVANLERIANEHAARHGWPRDTALKYLRDIMRYTLTDEMRQAMDRFFRLADKHGLLHRTGIT
jgi:chorismate dehydratase